MTMLEKVARAIRQTEDKAWKARSKINRSKRERYEDFRQKTHLECARVVVTILGEQQ